jgi:hypothetical protein
MTPMGASRKPSIRKLRRDAEQHRSRLDPMRRCGRPTKDGLSCGRILQWYEFACSGHATEAEQDAALDLLRAAEWRAGR